MRIVNCVECGDKFHTRYGNAKLCSDICRDRRRKQYLREYAVAYYTANTEKYKEWDREYRAANPEQIKERKRKYYLARPQMRDRQREYYLANKEICRERGRKYHQKIRAILNYVKELGIISTGDLK